MSRCVRRLLLPIVVLVLARPLTAQPCTDPALTWLGHEGWDAPDADGLVHHIHNEGCVPLAVVFDGVSRPFVQHFEQTIVLFRRSPTGFIKLVRWEVAQGQVIKAVDPPDSSLTCAQHTLGEVCTLVVSADVDFSLAKCSGLQRLNIRLMYDAPTGFPQGEMETASNYVVEIENGTPPCAAAVNPYTIGTGWEKEHIAPLARNHRYPTAGARQDQVLVAKTGVPFPWTISAVARVGFSASDPAHGAFIAIDPHNHDGNPGCVIVDGPPINAPQDVTIIRRNGTVPCLVDNGDGSFGPGVKPQPIASGWHLLMLRAAGTHDTVDNPGLFDHAVGNSVSAGVFKFTFLVP